MAKITRSQAFQKLPLHKTRVYIYNRQRELHLKKLPIKNCITSLLSYLNIVCDEISIYFVSDAKMRKIHKDFFGDASSTDCMSFPMDEKHLGEIFVCPQTAIEYSRKKGLDAYQETLLYIIHGVLHLLGYDDLDPKDRKTMRKMEKKCMDHLINQGISLAPLSN